MRDSIVIIGSGLMGAGIACRAALANNPVVLLDVDMEKALDGVDRASICIRELEKNGLCTTSQRENALKLLSAGVNTNDAMEKARIVIEAITENLKAKQELFCLIDSMLPKEVPILSNTSGLRISDISRDVKHPERTLTAHFWYPAHLVPLVEVVVGERSSLELAERIRDELNSWGKAAVVVKRDQPGQLANRILQAIFREAIDIVSTGLASAEDVDTAIKMGMGIRFPAWGPFEHIDAVGVDLVYSTQTTVLPDLNCETGPNAYLTKLIESNELGYKTGKGFYDWKKRDMKKLEKKRDEFIIKALKILMEDNK